MQVWHLLCSWLSWHNEIVGWKTWMWILPLPIIFLPPPPLYFLCEQYILVTAGQHDIVCKIAYYIGPDETLPYIAHKDANCHFSEKNPHNKWTSNFSLCSEELMSLWMDNEKEMDEMNKAVTFYFLLYLFFITYVKIIL